MTQNLVIVESPSKAKTINKYLGNNYEVLASYGHIRDLPSKNGSVKPEENFLMEYQINEKSSKYAQAIVKAAKNCDNIFLASDPDREGEAIAWHVVEMLKEKKALKKETPINRVVFNEITQKAVINAFTKPRAIDMNLVNAQQARRALDYLVGFTLSPVLWHKLPGSKSAGRVQSVALRLICERDYEIAKFISQEYWSIEGDFSNLSDQHFKAKLVNFEQKKLEKLDITNLKQAEDIKTKLLDKTYQITSVEKKRVQRYPASPFITSTLQQEASRKLGYGASRTMQVAQKLYEGIAIDGETTGLITYMRTDGVQLSQDAVENIRSLIGNVYGKQYLPKEAKIYKSKVKNAQEAHEAIRPTNVNLTPEILRDSLSPEQFNLYELIWKRTVACQMNPADFDQTIIEITATDNLAKFRASGSILVFDGFKKLYIEGLDDQEAEDEDKKLLPLVNENEPSTLHSIKCDQHFTEPLPRYSEASLVKKLEELGIGRPSTYANIISVLQDREYVRLEKKRFYSEDRGKIVTAFLIHYFNKYVQYDFTAHLEDSLDLISNGNLEWKDLLKTFWQDFIFFIDEAKLQKNGDIANLICEDLAHNLALTDYPQTCQVCNTGKLLLRTGKFGLFYACSNYPDCKNIVPFGNNNKNSQQEEPVAENINKLIGQLNDQDVFLKKGPYGFYFQTGEGKNVKRSSLPKFIDPQQAGIEHAIRLLSLPLDLGNHPDDQSLITLHSGRFGPYIAYNNNSYSLPNRELIMSIDLKQAIEIIKQGKTKKGDKKSK